MPLKKGARYTYTDTEKTMWTDVMIRNMTPEEKLHYGLPLMSNDVELWTETQLRSSVFDSVSRALGRVKSEEEIAEVLKGYENVVPIK